jgi:hypothetical protein
MGGHLRPFSGVVREIRRQITLKVWISADARPREVLRITKKAAGNEPK